MDFSSETANSGNSSSSSQVSEQLSEKEGDDECMVGGKQPDEDLG